MACTTVWNNGKTVWIMLTMNVHELYSEDNGRFLVVITGEAGGYFLRVCWLVVKVVYILNKGKCRNLKEAKEIV